MHYFLEDLTGFSAATLLALLLILVPGFGIARLASRARLIDAEGLEHACWGVIFGPAILPAVDALCLRWVGFGGVLALHLALLAAGARPALQAARLVPLRWWSAVVLCWLLVAWANVDFDWGGRLYQPVTVLDGVKHAAVVGALAQYGLPLRDPFFERPGIAGYYYYFYLGPALIRWLGGSLIDSRAAYAAGTFVTLLALPAMLLRLAEAAGLIPEGQRPRFIRIILLLCCLSGLDLLPCLWIWFKTGNALSQLDWWSEEVRWALTSVLWVPHHMTAIIAVYAGCLLLADTEGRLPARILLAGTAFATAFGCSLWIALAAAPILALWWVYERTKPDSTAFWVLPLSGLTALLLSLPQIGDIFAGRTISGAPLAFYMRPLGPIRVLPHSASEWIVHLAITPGGYGIEFGIFALGSILFLKDGGLVSARQTPIGRLLLVGAPVALVMVTFLRSAVIYNDFGWRAVWFAETPAMLWTGSYLAVRPNKLRTSPVWGAAFALGLAATLWDITGLRLIRPYYFPGFVNSNPQADFAARGAYRWIDRSLPADVVVQHNPTRFLRAFDFGLYSDHPVGVADVEARLFGADDQAVKQRIALVAPIFERPMQPAELRQRANAAGVRAILLTSADPLWQANGGPPRAWVCRYRGNGSCVMLIGELQ